MHSCGPMATGSAFNRQQPPIEGARTCRSKSGQGRPGNLVTLAVDVRAICRGSQIECSWSRPWPSRARLGGSTGGPRTATTEPRKSPSNSVSSPTEPPRLHDPETVAPPPSRGTGRPLKARAWHPLDGDPFIAQPRRPSALRHFLHRTIPSGPTRRSTSCSGIPSGQPACDERHRGTKSSTGETAAWCARPR